VVEDSLMIFCSSGEQYKASYIGIDIGEGYSVDLTMVAPTLLRIGRVTLAETIEPNGHRTPTNILGSS
jgi:hypothetical protein